jgi:RNA polymerase sigma-70 factor (ECF subfamily)
VSEPTDEELLASHLRGDQRAFGQLVSRHERRVYGICLRMLGNREDAQDAAQDAFLSALRRASTFREAAAFSTWLYRIAVNAATDHGDAVATAVTVQAALARIPEEFRAAVVLCDLLRLPYAEAAAVLEVPVGTVKSRVFRGRLALAGELRPEPAETARTPLDARIVHGPGTRTVGRASEPVETDERHHPSKE